MTDNTRVVTAKLSADLVSRIDEIASRIDRTKSWIVRQAVSEWLAEERRRHEFTIEALRGGRRRTGDRSRENRRAVRARSSNVAVRTRERSAALGTRRGNEHRLGSPAQSRPP